MIYSYLLFNFIVNCEVVSGKNRYDFLNYYLKREIAMMIHSGFSYRHCNSLYLSLEIVSEGFCVVCNILEINVLCAAKIDVYLSVKTCTSFQEVYKVLIFIEIEPVLY